jgi:hypothetical protein
MTVVNCWEFMHCGREPGGHRAARAGVCPAATFRPADGYLRGRNGGRACAYVTGTFCEDVVQGAYRDKNGRCQSCQFYGLLRRDHGVACSMPAFTKHLLRHDPPAYNVFFRQNWPLVTEPSD